MMSNSESDREPVETRGQGAATRTNRGRFITFEGGEGAGKTSNIAYARDFLSNRGIPVIVTREPGGTRLGEEIRGLLLGHRDEGMSSDTELLLMFAARSEHIAKVILPALRAGTWVISDRFTDATYAYQGVGRGIDPSRIRILEEWVQEGLRPDLTLLLDIPVVEGIERARGRSGPDRFESEELSFFERVRSGYLDIAHREPYRVKFIDAAQDIARVRRDLARVLNEFIEAIPPT